MDAILTSTPMRLALTEEHIARYTHPLLEGPVVPGQEQERARELIAQTLARHSYTNVLELAREFSIDLPAEHLGNAAANYALRRDNPRALDYAAWAYTQMGCVDKARKLRADACELRDRPRFPLTA